MKEVMGKVKRTLSILLSVAMVVTCVPQTGLSALAANETPGITEAAESEAAEVKVETPENDSEVTNDAEAEDVADGEDSTEVIGEGGEAQTPADDEQAEEFVVDDEAAEDGESEGVVNEPMNAEPYALTAADVDAPTGTGFTYTAGSYDETDGFNFTVAAATGYTITAVGYKYTKDGTETTEALGTTGGEYSIPASVFTDADEDTRITITVTATINEYTVTVTKPDTDVTVKYGIGDAELTTAVGTSITVEHGKVLKLSVVPAEGFAEIVKVDGEALPAKADHIYTVTVEDDITVDISVNKTSYKITWSKAAEATSGFTANDIKDVAVEFGTMVTETGEDDDKVYTIANDTDLTFTVTGLAANQRANVTYGEDNTPVQLKDGKYTITAEEIEELDEDIAIKVEVRKPSSSKIKVNTNPRVDSVTKVGETTSIGAEGVDAEEDSTFSFKVATKKFFKVDEVTVDNGEEVTTTGTGADTVYSFKVTDAEETNITITTVQDDDQCYKLALNINGDPGSATIELGLPEGETEQDDVALSGYLETEKALVTRNGVIHVKVTAAEHYALAATKGVDLVVPDGVTGAKMEEAKEENGTTVIPGEYDITLVEGKTITLKVTTDVEAISEAATVTFDKKAANMDLAVSEGQTGVTKTEGKDNEYVLAANTAKRLEFTITARGSYEPVVTLKDGDTLDQYCKHEDGESVYKYSVPAFEFGTSATIVIDEFEIKNILSFDGDVENVDVSVSLNGKELENEDGSYLVSQGTEVNVKVTEKDNCTLNSVEYTVDGNKTEPKVNKGVAEFKVTVKTDITIIVKATGKYKAAALTDIKDPLNPKEIEAVKGVYNVSYEGKYTVGLTKGVSAALENVVDVKVFDGNNQITDDRIAIDKTNVKAPSIQLTSGVQGKKLTVKLFVAGEGEDAESVDSEVSYTLQVSKVVTKITAPATAKQPTDTTKEYKVTTDGEIAKLAIKVEGTEGVIIGTPAFNENGLLEITTGQTVGKANVVISGGEDQSKTIEVTTTALISSATAKPTVALKSASDVSLTLTLGAKKIDTPTNGAVYYKVVVTPQTDSTVTMPSGLEPGAQTRYFLKDGDSQSECVVVGKTAQLGSGGAWKYDVKVSLVHVKNKNVVIDSTTIADQIVKVDGADAESKDEAKTFATLTPAWESNLKLKKGTTTIYTGEGGEEGVKIATAQFSKPTTYTDNVKVYDTSYPGDGGLAVWENDGVIYASAVYDEDGNGNITSSTAVGKHTIEVVAAAHLSSESNMPTMYASKATVVVTVVQGIDNLDVNVPSLSLYKKAGSVATIKATPIYNGDWSGKNKTVAPKTKKVTWDVVKDYDDTPFDSKVTIKNGTVTVAKDYVLKANDEDNTFMIKVSVNNGTEAKPKFIGIAWSAYSAPITITNEGAAVNNIAVIKSEGGNATVVAKTTRNENGKVVAVSKPATSIDGGQVVAFKADISKNSYSWEEIEALTVPKSDLTFKSSKAKNVAVNSWGGLTVNSPAKGVKLTVTANDGSNNKENLILDVDPDTPLSDKLALGIYKTNLTKEDGSYVDWYSGVYNPNGNQADADKAEIPVSYNGTAVSRLALQVWNLDPTADNNGKTWYKAAPKYTSYTLKVKSGGKLTGQDECTDGSKVYYATLDKRDAVIELSYTDKAGAKKKHLYKLENGDVLDSSATKITAKALNALHPVGTQEEQKVTIQLGNVDLTQYEGCTVTANVEVDWSKMNDKNAEALRSFAASMSAENYELKDIDAVKKTANIELSFEDDDEYPHFSLSSYALKVTLRESHEVPGENDTNKTVTSACSQSAAVTVKVDKVKKFTFKPTASYTIGGKDGYAVLSGKSSIPENELYLSFNKLLNLADKNGQENKFTDYFDIQDGKLVVKSSVVDTAKIDKANMTGYLVYTAMTDKAYYDNHDQSGVAKITVKVNDAKSVVKYTNSSDDSINNKAGQTAAVQVKVNTKDAIEAKNVVVASALLKKTSDPIEYTKVDENGKLVLTVTEDIEVPAKGKKVSAEIYIVPSDSKYLNKFVGENVKPTEDDYKNYAATVKVTLNVIKLTEEPPVETVNTVEAAESKVSAWKDSIKTATKTPKWLLEEFEDNDAVKTAVEEELRKFVNAAETIKIEVLAEGFTYVAATDSKEGSVSGTIKVSNIAEGSTEEPATIEFSFTIVKEKEEEPNPTPETPKAEDFEEDIQKAVDDAEITPIAYTPGDNDGEGTIDTGNATTVKGEILTAIKDAGIDGLTEDKFEVTIADNFTITKHPTETEEGSATIVVTVTNLEDEDDTADITITLPIPATGGSVG